MISSISFFSVHDGSNNHKCAENIAGFIIFEKCENNDFKYLIVTHKPSNKSGESQKIETPSPPKGETIF